MASAALASSLLPAGDQRLLFATPGGHLKASRRPVVKFGSTRLSQDSFYVKKVKLAKNKKHVAIRAAYSEGDGRTSHASIFVGGFILGGVIMGTLGCVFAPQISDALAGTYSRDLKKMLPKFLYNEEKALEKTRKVLTKKIAQLNDAIDTVSSQLKREDAPNGAAVASDEIEAAV